jgi:polyisoprenoid-binding protein YceI
MSWVRIAGAALAAMLLGAPAAQATLRVFRLDNDSATLAFSCDVLGMMPMEGVFTRFMAIVAFDEGAPADARATVTVDATSIKMDDETWLDDVQGPNFFDIARYPRFDFQSGTVTVEKPGVLSIHGALTMRGTTRPVTLHVRYDMPADGSDPTMEASVELDRSEFGMTALAPVLSDDVAIEVRGRLEPAFPPFRPWR